MHIITDIAALSHRNVPSASPVLNNAIPRAMELWNKMHWIIDFWHWKEL